MRDWTIEMAYDRLRTIYEEANALTTPRHERFVFLTMAVGDLSRCYRKKKADLYGIASAQVVAWFMSLSDELFRGKGGMLLADAMGRKYPADHCGYCGKLPCACSVENRAKHSPAPCSPQQLQWSLPEWQNHLYRLYGELNEKAGVHSALNRLSEEVSEVGFVLHDVDGFNEPLSQKRERISGEMSDVLAWVLGVGSLLDINVGREVERVYGPGCPVCHSHACCCRSFEQRPRNGKYTHRFMRAKDIAASLEPAT